jgi:hypothetical protein
MHLGCMPAVAAALAWASPGTWADDAPLPAADATAFADWRARFEAEVPRRLDPSPEQVARYVEQAREALAAAGRPIDAPQWVLVVDRNAHVQAALLLLAQPGSGPWPLLGATPAATGRPGGYEHFLTLLGAFEHGTANLDFRAEGTFNDHGIRGYGERGMRVFDFGWADAERTWDDRGRSPMRLQMHATDPDRLEPWLGQRGSKGCVRIPAALNRFLDRHGVLDADYEAAAARGELMWMLHPQRQPTPWPGRWLVVVDSGGSARPGWSPAPGDAATTPPVDSSAARTSTL